MTDDESAREPSLSLRSTEADETASSVSLADREYAIYRCTDCNNVVLTMQDCDGGMTCHDEPMERVEECALDIRPPDVRQVLLDAFGLPKAGLDVCLCVIGEGPLSPSELAERLEYDETTVRQYLNELVEFGLLQKSQLNRESGGFVNVYHSIDLDEMREETLVGFYAWAGEAASLIEEANLTKEDYRDGEYEDGLNEVFWERFEAREDS
ncbi:helix-turn-helix domain-containing protein [Halapricum sp. CBA1109]|uniref:helix-turn-helix domain-containing protein n=1 Tax=Halapricum sp. CBA1109 TaxID=2668068 RepID=UPI0012FA2D66|nr:helix-turn-helix domain-containing protein [Halapricum sp. CBA1109]MUV88546.1 helix-turn-helix domain-containing protein [Halapricum sp. CBA1109]